MDTMPIKIKKSQVIKIVQDSSLPGTGKCINENFPYKKDEYITYIRSFRESK